MLESFQELQAVWMKGLFLLLGFSVSVLEASEDLKAVKQQHPSVQQDPRGRCSS